MTINKYRLRTQKQYFKESNNKQIKKKKSQNQRNKKNKLYIKEH